MDIDGVDVGVGAGYEDGDEVGVGDGVGIGIGIGDGVGIGIGERRESGDPVVGIVGRGGGLVRRPCGTRGQGGPFPALKRGANQRCASGAWVL
jgi:hypothetical protein